MSKSIIWIVILILVVAGVLFYFGRGGESQAMGHIYVAFTDAAADMSNINEVRLTVKEISLHSETEGWVTLSNDTQTFNLLELKARGELRLAAEADVAAGTYNQARLMVEKVEIMKKDGTTAEAKLPSGELKIMTDVIVDAESNTHLTFDFMADQSLHVTGQGEFIFAPVIVMESRSNAVVSVDANQRVTVTGGNVDTTTTLGADIDGSVKANFKLDTTGGVMIENGVIKLNVTTDASGNIPASAKPTNNASAGSKVNIGGSIQY